MIQFKFIIINEQYQMNGYYIKAYCLSSFFIQSI